MHDTIITILVIEDEEILRESLADYLEDRDFRVVTAENGRVGLEVFARESPDLVLTDLRMPEVDGLDVLCRARELSPETPLIVVSGTGNISDSVQALRFGAWDYILKPVEDMSIIALAVDKALERARLRRENSEYQERLEALVRERTAELEQANVHLASINVRLRSVVESTHCLSMCTDVARFGSTLLDEFAHHMAASGGSIFLLEDSGLRRLATLEPDHVPEFIPCPLPDGSILGRAIRGKQALLIHDIAQEHTITSSGWDGYRDGSALLFPLPDDTGRIIGVITLHSKSSPPFVEQDKDIGAILVSYSCETLRAVRATETLRASESRFRDLADMLPEAVFETDSHGEVTYANRRAFNLFEYAAEVIPGGLNVLDLIAPEEQSRVKANLAMQLKGENPGTVEYQAVKKDGSTFPILFHADVIMKADEPCGLRGIVIDITAHKRAEDALRESEEKLNTLFGAMTEMVVLHEVVFNDQGEAVNYRITDCNHAFTTMTGIHKDDAAGKLATEVYQAESAPYLEEFNRVALTGEPYEYTAYYAPMDKHFMISVVSPQQGRFATVTTDITAIKQIQDVVAAKNKELENYLYATSHDLRSPLVNIQGFSQRLQKQTNAIKKAISECPLEPDIQQTIGKITDEGIPKSLDFILTNVSKMDTLINGLLQISRTGRIKISIRKIDMNALLEHIIRALSFQIEEAGADVVVETMTECYGDAALLDQLFSNIISNALKYRDKNRQLVVTITAQAQYHKVTYSIRDTGIGIARRHLDKIWDVFYRVDSQASEAGEGIGLSLVKRIVDKHKGKIRVESEEGQGSVFSIELQKNEFSE